MKICHVCNAECEDNAVLCYVCGADLTAELEEKFQELEKPVLLASMNDIVSAEIFKDILKDNGILYSCDESDESGMHVGFGGMLMAADIYVDDTDFQRAKELYEEFLNSQKGTEEFFDDFEEFIEIIFL